jgi:hypothetical protein
MPLAELLDPERGFVVNDTMKIKVEITVQVRPGQEVHCKVGVVQMLRQLAVA